MEEEIKLPVTSHDQVRQRLRDAGARLVDPRTLERNWVLDDGDGTVRRAGCLLRVRAAGGSGTITFKGTATFSGAVKRREEIESTVGDVDSMLAVLRHLGYVVVRRYEKYRESWELSGVTVMLDATPAGSFVEVEGPGGVLEDAVRGLGLDPQAAVEGTYLDIWLEYRLQHPDAPEDMVFR